MDRIRKYLSACMITAVLVWSGSAVLAPQLHELLGLRGAVTCDCSQCGNTTKVVYECLHTAWPPNPAGAQPSPANNWQGTACSATYCIKNTDYYAECPEMANGADCKYRVDNTLYIIKQEVKDGAPAGCATPNYAIVSYTSTECRPWSGEYACVTGSCGGALVPPTWYAQYRNYSRTVCNL
jgi:hypothetical protein